MRKKIITFLFILSFIPTSAFANLIKVNVSGLVCGFCVAGIEKTFKKLTEVDSVKVDLDNKLVTINTKSGKNIEDGKIKELITNSGYNVISIKR